MIVTDDRRGVAQALALEIESAGHSTLIVGADLCDFTSEEAVSRWLHEAREIGPIAGLIHAAPLGTSGEVGLDPRAWDDGIRSDLRGLFLLAKLVAPDLERSARDGGACLIAATGMGGRFGQDSAFPPWHGGIAGLVKTLAREWPEVRVRSVDLDPESPVETLAERLAEELFADDPRSEVGHRGGSRLALVARESPPVRDTGNALDSPPTRPDPDRRCPGDHSLGRPGTGPEVAAPAADRGHHARAFSRRIGRDAGISDPAKLKATLLHGAERRGERPTPQALESVYRSVMRAREVRANLSALRAAGASVNYGVADVRDGLLWAGCSAAGPSGSGLRRA